MTQQKHAPFCIRGHKKEKAGPCIKCRHEKEEAIKADPVLYEAWKKHRAALERVRHPSKKKLKAHAKAVAAKLLAKADMLVRQER